MTNEDPDRTARRVAAAFAGAVAQHWQTLLDRNLLGVYLIGSLAHGGFSRRYSDVDMAMVTERGLSQDALDRLRAEAVALSAEWGPKVSVFWTDRAFAVGRFPPLDRIDYLDRAVALIEHDRAEPARPTLEEIRDYLRGAPFANWSGNARRFAATNTLEPAERKTYLRTLLYPARLCFSYLTGRMSSNDDAVAFLRERRLPGLDADSIEQALQCRHAAADPDPLFGARTILPAQVEACAAVLAG